MALPAAAQDYPQVTGSGAHKDKIIWMSWGARRDTLEVGHTSSTRMSLGDRLLEVTCQIASITPRNKLGTNTLSSGGIEAYVPGSWTGDGLDELYNVGGPNGSNQAVWGISNKTDNAVYAFTMKCRATVGGSPYKVPGFVVADAEQSGYSGTRREYVSAQAKGSWRILERHASGACANQPYEAVLTTPEAGKQKLTLQAASGVPSSCTSPANTGIHGPMGIGFLSFSDDAYAGAGHEVTLELELAGSGKSALAFGLLSPYVDMGDAPASYGTAMHTVSPELVGGTLVAGQATDINKSTFQLAMFQSPARYRLGQLVDVDGRGEGFPGALADADDRNGVDDDDGVDIAALAPLTVQSTGVYEVPVSCAADGVARLQFQLPARGSLRAARTYLRVRGSVFPEEIALPTGIASVGEVEDYTLDITGEVRVSKVSQGGLDHFGFELGNTLDSAFDIQTIALGVPVPADAVAILRNGQDIVVSEHAPAGWQASDIRCTKQGGGAGFAPVYDLARGRVTIPAANVDAGAGFDCVFHNSVQTDLSLSKDNEAPVQGELLSGGLTRYTLAVTHRGVVPLSGVVVRDQPGAGLDCASGAPVDCDSDACPAGITVGDLTAPGGVTLGAIPANGTVHLSYQCRVL